MRKKLILLKSLYCILCLFGFSNISFDFILIIGAELLFTVIRVTLLFWTRECVIVAFPIRNCTTIQYFLVCGCQQLVDHFLLSSFFKLHLSIIYYYIITLITNSIERPSRGRRAWMNSMQNR